MNKKDVEKLESMKEQLDVIVSEIYDMVEAEDEKLDNIPENLQGSQRFDDMQTRRDNLESIKDDLENLIDELESEVINYE